MICDRQNLPITDRYRQRAELVEAGYQPTKCPDPNYPRDKDGYYIDPYPQKQRGPPALECQTKVYQQEVQVVYLKPPPPEPSGLLTVVEKRPRQPSPPPRKVIWCRSEPPQKPPPIYLRERIPEPPPPLAPRFCEVEVDPLPPPPPSYEKHTCAYPTPPPDIIVERWLPYGRRPPRPIKVVRAPCPPPRKPLPNICIIHDASEARIEHTLEGPQIRCDDPNVYCRSHGSTLLDLEHLREQLFGLLRNTHADENFLRRVAAVALTPSPQDNENQLTTCD
ncbi:unnamed protein product [Rotaria magnacalcarata]|uniref:Uncharacterized protein n=2 Tax=Rotaria magnacalcarata TaxID=392030 RepID=A0A816YQY2_9BILA|nr:unnamed protein product [Rotaria magnacalcarata]CAF2160539.1 unnamed protein product [Rotaria magnacalcarata]